MQNNILNKIKNIALSLIKNPLFYILIGLFVIDLVSKWAVQLNVKEGTTITLIPNFLVITLTHNTGTIFGLGNDNSVARIILIIIRTLLMIAIPIGYFWKGRGIKKRYKVCLLLIYAGCIGNLVDSMFYWPSIVGFSGVIDWIQFTFFKYIFNLADAYVTIAVFLLIIFFIIDEIKEIKEKNRKGAYTMTPEEYEKKLAEENKKENGFKDN